MQLSELELTKSQREKYEKIQAHKHVTERKNVDQYARDIRRALGDRNHKKTISMLRAQTKGTGEIKKYGEFAITQGLKRLKELEPRLRCKVCSTGRSSGEIQYWLAQDYSVTLSPLTLTGIAGVSRRSR